MKPLPFVVAFVLAAFPAHASGGFSCETSSQDAKLALKAGVTHGMGSPIFAFSGSTEIPGGEVPEDLRHVEFGREHVAQYWLDGDELRLVLYRERGEGPHGYVQVTLRTRVAGEDGVYRGAWQADVFNVDPAVERTLGGSVDCSVE